MIIDSLLQFSNSQALTATAASTDSVDLSSDRDIGPGEPMWLVVVSEVAPGGTSPTIVISIETDDNSSFSSAATVYTHASIAGAAFGAGTKVVIPWPMANERYIRVKYTLGGTSPTFTVSSFLTSQEPTSWTSLPDAI